MTISTKKLPVKLVKQTPGHCGPASLKMVLDYFGVNKSMEWLAQQLKTAHPEAVAGTTGHDIVSVAQDLGFEAIIKDWSEIEDLRYYLDKNIPVIISWFSEYDSHYSVAIKMDQDYLYHLDPEYSTLRKITIRRFKKIWFEFENGFAQQHPKLIVRRLIAVYPKGHIK